MGVIGALLILAGLATALIRAHALRLKAWDRPRFTTTRVFTRASGPAVLFLPLSGIACLYVVSALAALVASCALVLLAGWLLWARSPRSAALRLRKDVELLARRTQDAPRAVLVARVLQRWHPEWPAEVVERIATEHDTLRDVARVTVRMERGFRGL